MMKQFGVWANLMSLGAIDFGIIVDGAVIIVEGMVFHIHQRMKKTTSDINQAEMDEIAYDSASTMMNSAFFGQLIILIVFTPILFLTGIEGKMFRPMAQAVSFAILGALILSITYVPMMAALFLSKNISDKEIKIIGTRHGEKLYETLLTKEEYVKADDLEGYYRVPADNRDLNYEKSGWKVYPFLDVISIKKENLLDLYTTHNDWILNYDRTNIDKVFS